MSQINNGMIINKSEFELREIKPGMIACHECDAAQYCRQAEANPCEAFAVPPYSHYLARCSAK